MEILVAILAVFLVALTIINGISSYLFTILPKGKLGRNAINLIPKKDFCPTIGHRVYSVHFPEGGETYMYQLPMIVSKATRATSTNHRPTVKARNLTLVLPSAKRINYSNYKHQNTAKSLVGISPSGALTFVSDLYVGRSSDRQITNGCGIFYLLEHGDSVMADNRFDIENDLPVGVSLNIPPFLSDKQQLSIQEETVC